MTREDLEIIERQLEALVVDRRRLGGFDTNAESILIMCEALLRIARHLREKMPRSRKDGYTYTGD